MGIYTAKNLIWQFCGCLCSLQKSYNKLQVNIFNISFYKKITAWQRQGLCTTKIKCNSFSFTYVQHVTTILQWNLSWEAIAMRLPVLTDHTFLAGRPTFQCNWTCQQRPMLTSHISVVNGVVFQGRFYFLCNDIWISVPPTAVLHHAIFLCEWG